MNCIILGSNSDIAQSLVPMLERDYSIYGWTRGTELFTTQWDLILVALGTVKPVGPWYENDPDECVESNLLLPLRLLRHFWPFRNKDASVCFLAGSNPNKVQPNYSAYAISKMALLKAVEFMDAESDAKFFALGPGYVDTKIHLDRESLKHRTSTPIEDIYRCLMWCVRQEKWVIGGRNIHIADDWGDPVFSDTLALNSDMLKLRRCEK